MARQRSHSIEFKRQVAQEFIAGETLYGLAKRHDLSRQLIRDRRYRLRSGLWQRFNAPVRLPHARQFLSRRTRIRTSIAQGLAEPVTLYAALVGPPASGRSTVIRSIAGVLHKIEQARSMRGHTVVDRVADEIANQRQKRAL